MKNRTKQNMTAKRGARLQKRADDRRILRDMNNQLRVEYAAEQKK